MMFAMPCEETITQSCFSSCHWIEFLFCMLIMNKMLLLLRCACRFIRAPILLPVFLQALLHLWGPAHGGANEAALNMLHEIGDVSRYSINLLHAPKIQNDTFRLMGFGHRVYKNYDPRAKVMRETCHEVLDSRRRTQMILFSNWLWNLEKIALEDDYFIDKKLYPNVDFYSGITLSAIGIPTNMFTVIFAIARTVGWIAHWNEMISEKNLKISRPRQLYTGPEKRDYIPLSKR